MSVSIAIKDQIITKVQSLNTIQKVYPALNLNPSGWPVAFIITNTEEGEFSSNSENSRVYTYNCTIAFPLGQDFVTDSEGDRLDYAEDTIANAVEQVINTIDTDFELTSLPTGLTVLYVNAADVEWGFIDFEGGVARAANVILRVYTEITVV